MSHKCSSIAQRLHLPHLDYRELQGTAGNYREQPGTEIEVSMTLPKEIEVSMTLPKEKVMCRSTMLKLVLKNLTSETREPQHSAVPQAKFIIWATQIYCQKLAIACHG